MRITFSETQLELRDAVRAALTSGCPAATVRAAWSAPQPQVWALLAELGVLGINAPEACGGMAMGPVDWVLLLEETGRFAVPAPLIEAVAAVPFLVEADDPDTAAQIAAGEASVAIVDRDGLALDADRAIRVLALEGDRVFAIPKPTLTPQTSMDGARRLFAVEGARTSLDGDGPALRHRAQLACAAQLLGLGQHVLDAAVAYAKDRRQFGKPIGSFQAVQHHLVDALTKLRFAAPMVHRAAWSLEEAHPDRALHVAMAKLYASEAARLACRKSLQVHGAIGYTHELDLHLWMKRIWALAAAWGEPAALRDVAAAAVLDARPVHHEEK